jgi:hypothetical protein
MQKESLAALGSIVVANVNSRLALTQALSQLSKECYNQFKSQFIDSLSNANRDLYNKLCQIPYAEKDWWRDQHDIIVTRAMAKITQGEAERGAELLPEWLITVALIHDRGYGVLANTPQQETENYLKTAGAHWENIDIRLRHSYLSRELAEISLLGRHPEMLNSEPYVRVGTCQHTIHNSEAELFLEIVEKHDHPLIERYEDLPQLGRHHFDADSLYSISLSSFVKDYLSYLSDDKKRTQIQQSGIFGSEGFTLRDLLTIRLSRYYTCESELPLNWPIDSSPLNTNAYQLAEGRRCLVPHSVAAKQLTDTAFLRLHECVIQFERAPEIGSFIAWMRGALFEEMNQYFLPPL